MLTVINGDNDNEQKGNEQRQIVKIIRERRKSNVSSRIYRNEYNIETPTKAGGRMIERPWPMASTSETLDANNDTTTAAVHNTAALREWNYSYRMLALLNKTE